MVVPNTSSSVRATSYSNDVIGRLVDTLEQCGLVKRVPHSVSNIRMPAITHISSVSSIVDQASTTPVIGLLSLPPESNSGETEPSPEVMSSAVERPTQIHIASTTSAVSANHFLIRLAHSELQFNNEDIPEPPAGIPFLVDTLAQMWDDASPHWLGSSPLIIKSVPVPLKYWRDVYGNRSSSATWTRIKSTWHRWKVGCLCMSSLSESNVLTNCCS